MLNPEKFGKCIRSRVSQKNTNINRTASQSLNCSNLATNKTTLGGQPQFKPLEKDEKMSTSYLFNK
jgi:hypothetical protein